MINNEEIRKEMESGESKKVAAMLESLDENSKTLAKTYMSALADRQRIERRKNLRHA